MSNIYNEEIKVLNEKWDWLFKDYDGTDVDKINTQKVLDSSYKFMVADDIISEDVLEALREEVLEEAPTKSTATGTVIPKVLFPMIRRFMPALIANELVSVQPIYGRQGIVYYTQYKYTNTKGETTAADEFSGNALVPGAGAGFETWYSSEKIGPFTATVAANGGTTTISAGAAITNVLGTDSTGYTIKRYEVYNADTGTAYTVALTDIAVTASTGAIVLDDAATGPWTAGDDIIMYVVYDQEASDKIPEMEFTIDSQNVTTTERKLKVRWTKEAEQDMKSQHKMDIDSELVKMASAEANYEIDREIIKHITDAVPTALSKIHNFAADAATTGNNTSGNYLDRHRALVQKIHLLAARMVQYNRQGTANWAVVSPEVASVLQMLPEFQRVAVKKSTGVYNLGSMSGIKFYVDPNKIGNEAYEILLGFKSGITNYGAGVVYSPYANWMSGTVINPENFNSIRGFFSRYAITTLPRGQYYYAKLSVLNAIL